MKKLILSIILTGTRKVGDFLVSGLWDSNDYGLFVLLKHSLWPKMMHAILITDKFLDKLLTFWCGMKE